MAVKEIYCNTDLEEKSTACHGEATLEELQWSDSTNRVGNPEKKERKSENLWAVPLLSGRSEWNIQTKAMKGFHWCIGTSVGHREERARRRTCRREQPYHTDTPGHLGKVFPCSPGQGVHSLFVGMLIH